MMWMCITHGSLHPHNHIHSHKAKLAFSGQSTLPQTHPPNMKCRSPHMTPHDSLIFTHLHTPPLPPFMQVNYEPIDHQTACYMHFHSNQMPNPSHSHPFILLPPPHMRKVRLSHHHTSTVPDSLRCQPQC